nr:ribonuclease H-like domain-containing protein [Tanacetum cinerariifolium]
LRFDFPYSASLGHDLGCALLRKKFKEDLFTYCIENGIFQDFQDTSEPSNDNTNVAPQEPFVAKQDPSENSSQSTPQINHHCCYECGDSLEDIFFHKCTCELCGKGAHYGYNCLPKVPIIPNPEPCHNQTVDELPQTLPMYINAPSWNRLTICYNDDDDEDCTIAITAILSTEEPDNSLSMVSVENLVPIPSESEGIPDNMCDVPFHENSSTLDVLKDQFEDFSDSNDDSTSIDDDSFSIDDIEYVEASPPDSELISSEVMEIVIPEVGGIDDDILLTIKDDILSEKLLNINLLIANIETLKDNPIPFFDFMTKSSSTYLNFFLRRLTVSLTFSEAGVLHVNWISFGHCVSHRGKRQPGELKHLSSQRKIKQKRFPGGAWLSSAHDELTEKELKQIEADDQAIQTILLGLPEDIYAAVDSCETSQEIWLRVQKMMKGSDIGIQEKKAKLFNEWESGINTFQKRLPEVDDLKAKRLAKTQDPLALMETSNNPYTFPVLHQDQPSFNQNYMQKPMPNLEDITDPKTTMNMALALMAKAFKLNYSTPTNNNHRISSNPRNRQIAQLRINMGQDRQMQMVGGNDGNQFRQYVGQNVGNLNGYNDIQNNSNGNSNLVAARAEVKPKRRDAAYLQTQLLIAQKEEAGIQLQAEEFDLMAAAADLDAIEEVNANCILMANL